MNAKVSNGQLVQSSLGGAGRGQKLNSNLEWPYSINKLRNWVSSCVNNASCG